MYRRQTHSSTLQTHCKLYRPFIQYRPTALHFRSTFDHIDTICCSADSAQTVVRTNCSTEKDTLSIYISTRLRLEMYRPTHPNYRTTLGYTQTHFVYVAKSLLNAKTYFSFCSPSSDCANPLQTVQTLGFADPRVCQYRVMFQFANFFWRFKFSNIIFNQ